MTTRRKPRRTYDWTWAQLSARFLKAHPMCAVIGCGRRAKHVDHIENVKSAPERRLDPTNLQSLCQRHHNAVTIGYDSGTIRGACDAEGNSLDPQHPWAAATNAEAIRRVNVPAAVDSPLAARLKFNAVRRRQK